MSFSDEINNDISDVIKSVSSVLILKILIRAGKPLARNEIIKELIRLLTNKDEHEGLQRTFEKTSFFYPLMNKLAPDDDTGRLLVKDRKYEVNPNAKIKKNSEEKIIEFKDLLNQLSKALN